MLLFAAKMKNILNFEKALFLVFVISIMALIYTTSNHRYSKNLSEADIVISKLTDGDNDISLIKSNEVDLKKLETFHRMSYSQAKEMLGVKKDFCIYFEDEKGNLMKMDSLGYGIGSSSIYINGKPCQ